MNTNGSPDLISSFLGYRTSRRFFIALGIILNLKFYFPIS